MMDAPVPAPSLRGRHRRTHPARSLAARFSAVRPWSAQRLADFEHLAMLAGRLVPVALMLFLAQSYFLAGFFVEPIFNLPLGVLTVAALVGITARDYRADIRNHEFIDDLRRQSFEVAEDARRREAALRDDIGRLVEAAVDAAIPPAVLGAHLGLMGPSLVDLLATPSVARQEQLLAQLERTAVGACAELVDVAAGGGHAVLYRRVGRRFEPRWPQGPWPTPPLAAPRTSKHARQMGSLLRQRRIVQSIVPTDLGRSRLSVAIPIHAGRRGVGVLVAQREGDCSLAAGELEALVVIAHLLAAASAGAHDGGHRRPAASASTRARWNRRRAEVVIPMRFGRLIRSDLAADLKSTVETKESRQAVSAATLERWPVTRSRF